MQWSAGTIYLLHIAQFYYAQRSTLDSYRNRDHSWKLGGLDATQPTGQAHAWTVAGIPRDAGAGHVPGWLASRTSFSETPPRSSVPVHTVHGSHNVGLWRRRRQGQQWRYAGGELCHYCDGQFHIGFGHIDSCHQANLGRPVGVVNSPAHKLPVSIPGPFCMASHATEQACGLSVEEGDSAFDERTHLGSR